VRLCVSMLSVQYYIQMMFAKKLFGLEIFLKIRVVALTILEILSLCLHDVLAVSIMNHTSGS